MLVDHLEASPAFKRTVKESQYLDREEERRLLTRWVECRDERALDQLIRSFARMVMKQARFFAKVSGVSIDDLYQEGNIGLLEAAKRFSLDHDVRFGTYATWWVKSSMQEYTARHKSLFRTDSVARIKRRTGESAQQIDLEFEPAYDGPGPDEQVEQASLHAHQCDEIDAALSRLPERDQYIIRSRHLRHDDDKLTLLELSEELGISRERVRQLEERALARLTITLRRRKKYLL